MSDDNIIKSGPLKGKRVKFEFAPRNQVEQYEKQTVRGEERCKVVGWNGRYIRSVVCTIDRHVNGDETVRLINARHASKREKRDYHHQVTEAIMEQHKLPQEVLDYIKQHENDSDDGIDFSDDPDGFTGPIRGGGMVALRRDLRESSSRKTFKEFVRPPDSTDDL